MKKKTKQAKEVDSFFEDDDNIKNKEVYKEENNKTENIAVKETSSSNSFKNTIYRYKNGESCTVCYDPKDINYIERIMS